MRKLKLKVNYQGKKGGGEVSAIAAERAARDQSLLPTFKGTIPLNLNAQGIKKRKKPDLQTKEQMSAKTPVDLAQATTDC